MTREIIDVDIMVGTIIDMFLKIAQDMNYSTQKD